MLGVLLALSLQVRAQDPGAAASGLSLGPILAVPSAAIWGLTIGKLGARVILGPSLAHEAPAASTPTRDRLVAIGAAGLQVAGAAGGGLVGRAWARSAPTPREVLEIDLVGALGAQTGYGVATLLAGQEYGCRTVRACERYVSNTRIRYAGGLAGAAAGLGAGGWLSERWEPDPPQLLLSGVIGLDLTLLATVSQANAVSWRPGLARTAFHGGVAGGLALTHLTRPDLQQTWMSAWGAAVGGALGVGAVGLANAGRSTQAGLAVGAAAGTALGALGAHALDPSAGDAALAGLAVPIGLGEGLALSALGANAGLLTEDQRFGLTVAAPALGALGLTALAPLVEPRPEDMLFLGTSAAWGAWLGGLTPSALGLELGPSGRVLAPLIAGNAALIGGGVLLSERTLGLEPSATWLAQLGGLGGTVLGAGVGAALRPEPQAVSAGALVGATAGLVTGGVLRAARGPRPAPTVSLRPPRLPGTWSACATPATMQDGSLGLSAQVSATGW